MPKIGHLDAQGAVRASEAAKRPVRDARLDAERLRNRGQAHQEFDSKRARSVPKVKTAIDDRWTRFFLARLPQHRGEQSVNPREQRQQLPSHGIQVRAEERGANLSEEQKIEAEKHRLHSIWV